MNGTRFVSLLLILLACSASLNAQNRCVEVFHAKYGGPGKDEGQAIVYTRNGDVAVAGNTNSPGTQGTDAFLMMLGPTGNLLWSKYYGNAGEDYFYRLKQTPDGGFIAVGTSYTSVYPAGLLWVVKTDAAGNMTWSRKMHFGTSDRIKAVDVIPLSSGGYAVAANVNDSSALAEVLITRLDATGNPVWAKRFDEGHDEGILTIAEDGSDLLAAGYTTGDFRDAFLMRINLITANVTAARRFTAVPDSHEEGAAIELLPDGLKLVLKTYPPYGPYDTYNTGLTLISVNLDRQWNVTGNGIKSAVRNSRTSGRITYARVKPIPGDGMVVGLHSDYIHTNAGTMVWLDRRGRAAVTTGYNHQEGTMMDVDVTGNYGWVGAGRNQEAGGDYDVAVTKADRMGKVGLQGCESILIGASVAENITVSGTQYDWASTPAATMTLVPEIPVQQTGVFTMTFNQCGATFCKPSPVPGSGAVCTKGLFTKIKDDYQTESFDAVRMDDGDIMTLTFRQFAPVYQYPQLIRIKPDGTVRWAKQISLDGTDGTFKYAYKMQKLSDNSVLVYGFSALMKIDINGDLVWAQEIHLRSGGMYGFNAVAEAENGDIILTTGYGLMRIDGAAGNILWENQINQDRNPFARGLVVEDGAVFLALEYARQHPNGFMAVARFNAATGAFEWVRQYSHPGKEMEVFNLMKSGNVLTVGIGLISEISLFNFDYRAGAVRLSAADGSQINGWRLSDKMIARTTATQYNGEILALHMDAAPGDSLIFGHRTITGRDTSLSIMKFSTDGKLGWIRKYPNLKSHIVSSIRSDGEGILISGNSFPRMMPELEREAFVMRTDRSGVIEGATAGDCYSVAETGTIVPMTLKEDVPTLQGAKLAIEGMFVPGDVFTDHVLAVYAVPSCDVPAACGSISISGPARICDISEEYTFRADKSAGCDEPVTWTADPAMVEIISQSENEITLTFRKDGVVQLKGSIDGGCKIISETVRVEVVKTSATASLGPDKILCKGGTAVLAPGEGFASYRWQDGSTNATFAAAAPGDYSVVVTDACNNAFTEEITLHPQPDYAFSLGADIRKCPEVVVAVDIPQGFNNYTWNTDFNMEVHGPKVELSPDRDTMYILVAEKEPGCFVRDTVRVEMIPPVPVSLGADADLCAGDSLFLRVPQGFTDVVWNTGLRDYSFFAKNAGQYTVRATDHQGCATFDTLVIRSLLPLPDASLPQDGILCEGAGKVLRVAGGISWLWSTGEQTPAINIHQPGKWWVTVTGSNGCVASDTLEINGFKDNPSRFLPDDMTICRQSAYILQPGKHFNTYRWNTGDNTPGISIRQPGVYWLEVTDANGCSGRDEVEISMKDCITAVWFPNAFSPDGDGRNDIFRPVVKGELEYYHLRIFHRWGTLVFESKDPGKGWSGTMQAVPATAGTYVWMCEYKLKHEGLKQENGAVIIIR